MPTRRFRNVVLLCAFVLFGPMGATGAIGTAQAAPADAQALLTARFKNLATEKCLDVRDESYDDAAVVQQFKCKDGQNQVFGVGSNDVGGTALYTRRSYKCVEPRDGTYDGAGVQQWTCNNSFAQQWRMDTIHDHIAKLRHLASGKCLEDIGRPDGNRREVGLMPCTGASNQAWRY